MEKIFKEFKIQRVFKKGEILYYEKTPSLGLFYISSGAVKIYKTDNKNRKVILRLASVGDIFGFGHLIGEKIHLDSAKALEETQCHFIDESGLEDLMLKNPELSPLLMKMIGKELMLSQHRCLDLINKNVRERLATHFHYMAQHHSEVVDGKIRIKVQLSREEIASVIGTASETAIRFISEFKELGLIEEQDRVFHIVNSERLSSIGSW
jgi:CRP-like cAMP-binding protein